MLTIRYARPEMRAPLRTWLRVQARTIAGLCTMAVALIAMSAGEHDCAAMSSGALDCPLAGEGALVQGMVLHAASSPARAARAHARDTVREAPARIPA